MLIFRNDFCVVFLHEIVLCQQFVVAIFAIESNFSDLSSAKREQQERGSRNVVQSLRQMSSDTEEKMKKLFNTSYFIAKHERPFSDFKDFFKLHVKNGLSLGETYINDKGCRVFIEEIDGVMKEDESQLVNKKHFISVMADSGTDTSNKDL